MTARTRALIALSAVGAVAVAGWLASHALRTRESSVPPAPVTRVPASWQSFRQGEGHVVHVQQAGIACEKCHGPGATMTTPSLQVCTGCHAAQAGMRHGLDTAPGMAPSAVGELADCLACHGFAAEAARSPWQCLGCHEQPQGTRTAIPHGAHTDCSGCHRPHDEPAIEPKACRDCHVTADNHHAGMSSDEGKNCLACHDAHGSATLANERCALCHERPEATFAGHERCAGCHVPHAFSATDTLSCTSCHRGQHTLGETQAAAHARCTSCHDPHAPKSVNDATCKSCHASVAPTHPAIEGHACLQCHAPHGASGATAAAASHMKVADAVACTSCHTLASGDQRAHGGKAACTTCHVPHGFALPARPQVCSTCHGAQLAALATNAGHAQCASCHQGHPHDAQMSPVACASCHSSVHARAEHTPCVACHEPHSGAPRTQAQSCESCHAEQHAGARPEHRECKRCHTPHEGKTLAPASCRSCHAEQAQQGHGKLGAGCGQCHGVHEPGKADHVHGAAAVSVGTALCTQCHAPATLGGLHRVQAHKTCNECHGGAHDSGPWSERATCVACHAAQKQHVPDAPLCQGCHVFQP